MVGAGVPGAEVRAAHHTQSRPPSATASGDASALVWLPPVQSAAPWLVRNRN